MNFDGSCLDSRSQGSEASQPTDKAGRAAEEQGGAGTTATRRPFRGSKAEDEAERPATTRCLFVATMILALSTGAPRSPSVTAGSEP